jgi:hypothetical protein
MAQAIKDHYRRLPVEPGFARLRTGEVMTDSQRGSQHAPSTTTSAATSTTARYRGRAGRQKRIEQHYRQSQWLRL